MKKQGEIIKQLTDRELLLNLYITQFIILILAFTLSRFLFGTWFYPLELITWDLQAVTLGVIAGLLVVLLELILVKWLPKHYFDDGGINERVFQKRSFLHIAFISAVVAFSEELLFRGVLQTYLGLLPASIIFALIHFRYLHKPFLFVFTVILSLFLGILYWYTGNLLTVMICHFLIDYLLGIAIRLKIVK
ncbi:MULTISPECIES: CPBP family intramembrane glutamic endopeptidase [Bacillaceae]|uniref:CPBP family intramembrane metalloprotease n=1 Tax=Evansella alkalicola TaxID=745819 RepID=A0ABS6K115_9BACI|nr:MULTISPECIES: type II CAAX endopeptidase family protein [Bacillaceae]MBU9723991.1 CPBP family intramembrane metalloprotease [Bacillus alkalicola]